MLQLVIDVSPIERMLATSPDVLLLYVLGPVAVLMLLSIIFWGMTQIYLNNRAGDFASKLKFSTLAIDIPVNEQSPKAVENLFAVVKGTKSVVTKKEGWLYGKFITPVSFEIVSIDGYIQFFIRAQSRFRDHLEAAIYAQYPEAEIAEVEDYTTHLPDEFPNETHELFGGEIILEEKAYLPIRTYEDFEHMASRDEKLKDPLNQLFEMMGKFKAGEQFWVHILVHPDGDGGWKKKAEEFILKTYGRKLPDQGKAGVMSKLAAPVAWIPREAASQFGLGFGAGGSDGDERSTFFVPTNTEKTQLDGVSKKFMKPGYQCKIRWAYVSRHETYRKGDRNTLWKGFISLFAHPAMNNFKYDPDTMPRDDYFWMIWEYRRKQRELMSALKGRSWGRGSTPMYLSVEELATLWHFPTIETRAPLIARTSSKRAEAPTYLPQAGIGESDELPDAPLIEVDEQGRPIQPVEQSADGAPEPRLGDDLADILPTEPLLEPGQEQASKDGTAPAPEEDQPFIPPNLPT